jgi:hypothetical protein
MELWPTCLLPRYGWAPSSPSESPLRLASRRVVLFIDKFPNRFVSFRFVCTHTSQSIEDPPRDCSTSDLRHIRRGEGELVTHRCSRPETNVSSLFENLATPLLCHLATVGSGLRWANNPPCSLCDLSQSVHPVPEHVLQNGQ